MNTQSFMSDFNTLHTDGIKVYSVESRGNVLQTCSRRDLYKISLLSGTGFVHFGEQIIPINSPVLLVSEPGTTCTWKLRTNDTLQYTCVFTRKFLTAQCFHWLNPCNLFSPGHPHVYNLDEEQSHFIGSIFRKMISSQSSVYPFKHELIQDQICVLLHTALRMKPSEDFAATAMFPVSRHIVLAGMQFPPEAQVLHFN